MWANLVRATQSTDEFTLDFVRLEPFEPPPGFGVVVARVAFSARVLGELVSALEAEWKLYAVRTLPKEVYGDEEPADDSG